MDAKTRQRLLLVFESFPEVKLAYFFGSRSRGEGGPLSDYDFAIYVNEQEPLKVHQIRVDLLEQICKVLKSDQVDVVMLTAAVSPELKYHAIAKGVLLFEREPFRVLMEPRILNEYFDHRTLLRMNGLTQA
jgi:uncharacterized protein